VPSSTPTRSLPAFQLPVDRNLFFAILALQMDFISRDDLVAAIQAWTRDRRQPLCEILVASGGLNAAEKSLLEAVVEGHLAGHPDDLRKSVGMLDVLALVERDLERIGDREVQAGLAQLIALQNLARTEAATLAPMSLSSEMLSAPTNGRFELLEPHARGGLGEVYLAHDRELNREVAVKRLQERHAGSADSRIRFLVEGEITGRLEHPGIVPVYGMGMSDDGRPYYAMRFIKGRTLREAIERLHASELKSENERRLERRHLLSRFIAVCNAVEYAHSRGVIHRDLKPGNIMLGKYGETLVVDWGLAKASQLNESTIPSAIEATDTGTTDTGTTDTDLTDTEPTLVPSSLSGSSETLPGSAIGTPGYMSPEQAKGVPEAIGPASDIYSLGVTLYVLLTGREPFGGVADPGKALARVQTGDFLPPRQVSSAVPAALNAVCLKAMSLAPGDRYPSCAALARDIERWLDDEPVGALREPLVARTFRWIRRHRVLAATSGVLAAAAFVAAVAGTVLLGRANTRIRAAAEEADRQRIAAEARRTEAVSQREAATRLLYVSQMNLAQRAWEESNIWRVRDLLAYQNPGQKDKTAAAQLSVAALAPASPTAAMKTAGAKTPREPRASEAGAVESERGREEFPADLRGWEWHHLFRVSNTERIYWIAWWARLAFTPDGQYLFFVDSRQPGRLTMRRATGKRHVKWSRGRGAPIMGVAVDRAAEVVAALDTDGKVKRWEVKTGIDLPAFKVSLPANSHSVFSLDGSRLAVSSWQAAGGGGSAGAGSIAIYSLADGHEIKQLQNPGAAVVHMAFTPAGDRLVCASSDRAVRIWNLRDGRDDGRPIRTLIGQKDNIRSIAVSGDGRTLALGGWNGGLKTWDLETGRELISFVGHTDAVTALVFTTDGKQLVSGSRDMTVKVWDKDGGSEVETFRGHVGAIYDLAASPTGDVASSGSDGTIRVWDAGSVQEPWRRRHPTAVSSVAYSPDGNSLAAGGPRFVEVWDVSSGRRRWTQGDRLAFDANLPETSPSHCLAFDSASRILAAGLANGTVQLRDALDGHVLRTIKAHAGRVTSVDFSPDGKVLASAGADRLVALWDPSDGHQLGLLKNFTDSPRCIVFSPDGRLLASVGDWGEPRIELWSVATKHVVRTMTTRGATYCAAFSRDGRELFTGGNDNVIRVWDVERGTVKREQMAHAGYVLCLALSADGSRLASCGVDGTVKIWDVATGEELQSLKPGGGFVYGVAFSPDGWRLAAGNYAGFLTVWDARPLTPQLHDELVAADLVATLRAKSFSKEDLLRRIRAQPVYDKPVRANALQIAESQWTDRSPEEVLPELRAWIDRLLTPQQAPAKSPSGQPAGKKIP
jgi:eukaryotic-like serine/threonine-protein kinase